MMTSADIEIQRLRRENTKLKRENSKLAEENAALTETHYLDQSTLVYYRRQIDFLIGALDEANSIGSYSTGNELVIGCG
jgi:hypothetical protein